MRSGWPVAKDPLQMVCELQDALINMSDALTSDLHVVRKHHDSLRRQTRHRARSTFDRCVPPMPDPVGSAFEPRDAASSDEEAGSGGGQPPADPCPFSFSGDHKLTLDSLAAEWLRPGAMLTGDIVVPGGAGMEAPENVDPNKRKPYRLLFIGRERDKLGQPRLRALHEAYGDEQAVDVRLRLAGKGDGGDRGGDGDVDGDGIIMEYSDNETFCSGRVTLRPYGEPAIVKAYQMFVLVRGRELKNEGKKLTDDAIRMLGAEWRALSEEGKQTYVARAAEATQTELEAFRKMMTAAGKDPSLGCVGLELCVEGTVQQLVRGQAGFFVPCGGVTHTFSLCGRAASSGQWVARARAWARFVRLECRLVSAYVVLASNVRRAKQVVQESRHAQGGSGGDGSDTRSDNAQAVQYARALLAMITSCGVSAEDEAGAGAGGSDSRDTQPARSAAALSVEKRDRVARAAGRQAEVACAELRYDAALLDALSFTSEDGPKERGGRREILAALEKNGLRRHEMHRLTDGVSLVQRDLIEVWTTADATESRLMHMPISNECMALWMVARERLQLAFDRASKSLGAAQARLPLDQVHSWRVPAPLPPSQPSQPQDDAAATAQSTPTASGAGVSMSCTICLGAIDVVAGEVALRLPCGHEFHESCAMEWLHANTTCPVCRSELALRPQSAEEEGEAEAGGEADVAAQDEGEESEEGEWETCSDDDGKDCESS